MTAPGTILLAKMLVPETEQPKTAGRVQLSDADMHKDANVLGAIARGTIDGGQLAFNVAIMLISFLALIALINGIFGGIHNQSDERKERDQHDRYVEGQLPSVDEIGRAHV